MPSSSQEAYKDIDCRTHANKTVHYVAIVAHLKQALLSFSGGLI